MKSQQDKSIEGGISRRQMRLHVVPLVRYFEGLPIPERKSTKALAEIKRISDLTVTAGNADCACWFKDVNGGDICYPYANPQECKNANGTPVPGDCPNFFAALHGSRSLARILSKASSPKRATRKAKSKPKRQV